LPTSYPHCFSLPLLLFCYGGKCTCFPFLPLVRVLDIQYFSSIMNQDVFFVFVVFGCMC